MLLSFPLLDNLEFAPVLDWSFEFLGGMLTCGFGDLLFLCGEILRLFLTKGKSYPRERSFADP